MKEYKLTKREEKMVKLTNMKAISVCLGEGSQCGKEIDQAIKNCRFLISQNVKGEVLKPWIKSTFKDIKNNSGFNLEKVNTKIKVLENQVENLVPWDKINAKKRGLVSLVDIAKLNTTGLANKKKDKEKLLSSLKEFKIFIKGFKQPATNTSNNPPSPTSPA